MLVIQVISLLVVAIAVAAGQALPGCPDRCGNLTVSYPFGIGEGCSKGRTFNVTCDESTEPPKLRAMGSNVIITNISIAEGELQVMNFIARDCYDENGKQTINRTSIFRFPPPFTISSTRNKFIAVGCDTYAILEGYSSKQDHDRYITGCMSVCSDLTSAVNGSCSGIGCCQSSIPSRLINRTITLESPSKHEAVWSFNPCSYAFIVEEGSFTFNPITSFQELYNTQLLPLILDWEIPGEPCVEARTKSDYACKATNSSCVNRTINNQTESSGYICRCLPGFTGNPYLLDGCVDIDECAYTNPCGNGTCKNLYGDYKCLCNKGFRSITIPGTRCIEDDTNNQSARKLLLILLGTGSVVGLLLLVIVVWWFRNVMKKRNDRIQKEKFYKQNGGLLLEQQLSSGEVNVEKIKLFSSKELENATDRFNLDRILGEGGQGTVFKGMLTDGRIVAVKKSKTINGGEVEQFINEIVILSQINHRNVVKLLGCCLETEVPLLIYEFLPNGTLSQYIHNQDEEFPFTWETRLRVSAEVAGALFYLHSAASYPIYHRDIKSTNILLDDKYKAKVADFGTSRSVSVDQTHLTTQVHGTFGYLDPEYFQSSQFTDKSDVYSFGVVLVELLTGQKPVSVTRPQESRSLATYFLTSMQQNCLFDIIDPQVMKDGGKEEITVAANIARRCLNLNGKKRPTMKEVAVQLEEVRSTIKSSDHVVQQNLAEEGDFRAHEVTTNAYWDVVSISTGPFTDGGTSSSCDVEPLLFSS